VSSKLFMLRAAALLWLVWGGVHVFAGVMCITLPTSEAIAGVADAVDPATVAMAYPAPAGAIVKQHGWNLGWIGLTTIVCAFAMWRPRWWPVALAALVGGLADAGYFVFIDLAGFARFVPGTVMTIVSASAIVLSFAAMMMRTNEPGGSNA
jgi:hypothetical protein